jgi:hypothetical protein
VGRDVSDLVAAYQLERLTRLSDADRAVHPLAVGDVVMNDDGIRYELLHRWDDVAWVAHPIGFHADVILADHALAATGDDRTYWWDA